MTKPLCHSALARGSTSRTAGCQFGETNCNARMMARGTTSRACVQQQQFGSSCDAWKNARGTSSRMCIDNDQRAKFGSSEDKLSGMHMQREHLNVHGPGVEPPNVRMKEIRDPIQNAMIPGIQKISGQPYNFGRPYMQCNLKGQYEKYKQ